MIRPARKTDSNRLTELSLQSKRYWNYPEDYFRVWESELTLTDLYINSNTVFVYEKNGRIIGYYAMVRLDQPIHVNGIRIDNGDWLEHLFIDPVHIGKGYGSKLMAHMRMYCAENGITKVKIMADPNSKGFYIRMGAKYKGEWPSSIPGRTVPYLELETGSL